MIGLDAAFPEYWENGTPCREALRFFLTQRPAGDACSAANYELILDGDAVTLKDSVSPEELAELLSGDFLLTCGAFFFYPAQGRTIWPAPARRPFWSTMWDSSRSTRKKNSIYRSA